MIESTEIQNGLPKPFTVTSGESGSGKSLLTNDDIINAIKQVYDEELPINVYDLGLIYDIQILKNGDVNVDMTLTSPWCIMAEILPRKVAETVSSLTGCGLVTVKVVWEPLWTPDRLTDDGKAILQLL